VNAQSLEIHSVIGLTSPASLLFGQVKSIDRNPSKWRIIWTGASLNGTFMAVAQPIALGEAFR
jgi:hypothetical protein